MSGFDYSWLNLNKQRLLRGERLLSLRGQEGGFKPGSGHAGFQEWVHRRQLLVSLQVRKKFPVAFWDFNAGSG